MNNVIEPIKGFIGLTIAAPLAGAAIGAVGNVAGLTSGIAGATQSFIGIGLAGHAAGLLGFKK